MFRLAKELGMTVAELGRRVGNSELVEWMAFSSIEPFGSEVESWRSGNVCASIWNVQATKKSKIRQPGDFMPKISKKKELPVFSPEIARSMFGGNRK